MELLQAVENELGSNSLEHGTVEKSKEVGEWRRMQRMQRIHNYSQSL